MQMLSQDPKATLKREAAPSVTGEQVFRVLCMPWREL